MIALGGDHAGYAYKEIIKEYLTRKGLAFCDFGTNSTDSCNYADFAYEAAKAVADGRCDRGILVCGTGIGISIAANKVQGIRAALCHDVFSAKATRMHNDANMIAFGARVIGTGAMLEVLDAFLNTEFEGGRHADRIARIHEIEQEGR